MACPAPTMPILGRVPARWRASPRAQVVADVSIALLGGCVLMAGPISVGRYHLATDDGVMRFAALDKHGGTLESLELEEHATSLYQVATTERQDWSAFGAASAFVDAVGRHAAERALRDLHAGVGRRGVDRGVAWRPSRRWHHTQAEREACRSLTCPQCNPRRS